MAASLRSCLNISPDVSLKQYLDMVRKEGLKPLVVFKAKLPAGFYDTVSFKYLANFQSIKNAIEETPTWNQVRLYKEIMEALGMKPQIVKDESITSCWLGDNLELYDGSSVNKWPDLASICVDSDGYVQVRLCRLCSWKTCNKPPLKFKNGNIIYQSIVMCDKCQSENAP